MKKLTSLQIFMLMSLAVGSFNVYASEDEAAVEYQLQAVEDRIAPAQVLSDLAESNPMAIERIIEDEADLEATFNSIKRFVDKKNKEINKLSQEQEFHEEKIAKLAVELADAQAMFEITMARQKAKHRHSNRHEQAIKDALMKAEQGVKSLSKKAMLNLNQIGKNFSKGFYRNRSK